MLNQYLFDLDKAWTFVFIATTSMYYHIVPLLISKALKSRSSILDYEMKKKSNSRYSLPSVPFYPLYKTILVGR